MTSPTPAQAHEDHTRWKSESAMWRDDIQQWGKEHESALLELSDALATHNSALSDHLQSINLHGTKVKEAEHHIVEYERSMAENTGVEDLNLGGVHTLESEKQDQLRVAHERIKRHHYSAMAKLSVLVEAMGAQM